MAKKGASRHIPRVFISHSSEDAEFARWLTEELEKHNLGVWLDKKELKVGDSIAEGIARSLRSTDYFVVVLSKASVKSRWVKQELDAALMRQLSGKGTVVLPVLLQDCAIPELLRARVYADFRLDREMALAQLLDVLGQEVFDDKLAEPTVEATAADEPRATDVSAGATAQPGQQVATAECVERLRNMRMGDLRRLIMEKMTRSEVGAVWFDLFETTMDDDMRGRELVECVVDLLIRAKKRMLLPQLWLHLCQELRQFRLPTDSTPETAHVSSPMGETRREPISSGPSADGSGQSPRRVSLATWILGALYLVFHLVILVFWFDELYAYVPLMLGLISALLAGLFASFLTGDIRVTGKPGGRLTGLRIRASGGAAVFTLVLVLWFLAGTIGISQPPDPRNGPPPSRAGSDSDNPASALRARLDEAQKLMELGRHKTAELKFKEIAGEAHKAKLQLIEVKAVRLQADCHRLMWRIRTAIKLYDQALRLLVGEKVAEHVANDQLPATAHSLSPELPGASERRELAYIVRGRAECASLEAGCEEDAEVALEMFREAEALFGGSDHEDDGLIRAKLGRAELLRALGRVEEANNALLDVRVSESASNRLRAFVALGRGRLLTAKGRPVLEEGLAAMAEAARFEEDGQAEAADARRVAGQGALAEGKRLLRQAAGRFEEALEVLLEVGPDVELPALVGRFRDPKLNHDLGRQIIIHLMDVLIDLEDKMPIDQLEPAFRADFDVNKDPVSAMYWGMVRARFYKRTNDFAEAASVLRTTLTALSHRTPETAICRTFARGVISLLEIDLDWAVHENDRNGNPEAARQRLADAEKWWNKGMKALQDEGLWRKCDPLVEDYHAYKAELDRMKDALEGLQPSSLTSEEDASEIVAP